MTLEADPDEGGTVNVDAEGWYPPGAGVTVEATANTGWEFVNWTSQEGTFAADSDPNTTFTMPGDDVTVTANFELIDYEVSLSVDPEGSGTVSGDGIYNFEDSVTIEATPETGWKFVNWTDDDDGDAEVSTDASYTFDMPADDVNYTANFVELGIDDDSVLLDGDEGYVDDSQGTVWVIDIADFIANGALNPGGPNDQEDFQLTVTFVTGFTVNFVTFTVEAADIDFCTSWADLFAALDGESEETGVRNSPFSWANRANDQATLTWDAAELKLTVTSERIFTPDGHPLPDDRNIASVQFIN